MIPSLSLGPLSLPTAGLTYILAAWFSLWLVEKAAQRLHLRVADTYGLAVTAVFSGIIGARLLFVIEYWAAFQENLLGIIWPLNTGYNVLGGVVIGVVAGFFYGRYKQLPAAATLDALIPGILLALIAVSFADFAAGPGYGTLTSVPWGVSLYGVRRHPVQLYEILGALLALGIWWRIHNRRAFAGQAALLSTLLYAAVRLFTDTYRQNAWVTPAGYHILQIISLAIILGSMFLLMRQTVPASSESATIESSSSE